MKMLPNLPKMFLGLPILVAVCFVSLPAADAAPKKDKKDANSKKVAEKVDLPTTGVAALIPTKGNKVKGIIVLQQKKEGLHLSGKVVGLTPGLHGFHIHEYGDLRDVQGKAAGGHFNPGGHKHGGPDDEEHHAGDLGNINANEDGVAKVDMMVPWLKLHFVVGRSIVVHGGKDDLTSQPSGDAGPRVAVGVIGIAEPAQKKKPKKNGPKK